MTAAPLSAPSRDPNFSTQGAADQGVNELLPQRPSRDHLHFDRVSYLADMIGEMQVMASEAKCTTLAGILALAHAEAQQQLRGR